MAYRSDQLTRCARCSSALREHEGELSPMGDLLCRGCVVAASVAAADLSIASAGTRITAAGMRQTDRRRSSTVGYALLAMPAILALGCVIQLLDHWLTHGSCSELACLGLVLLPAVCMIASAPLCLAAIFFSAPATRTRVALGVLIVLATMLATCGGASL